VTDKANIYREKFQDKQRAISNNLHLDPRYNNTIILLLDAGVINAELVSVLHNLDVNLRGERVVSYIIAVNDLDVYEKFLVVWRNVKKAAAAEFEGQLDRYLSGYGMTRHTLVTAPPTVQQEAGNLIKIKVREV
jgi:hypothetical protein